jgi:hypothetical protein
METICKIVNNNLYYPKSIHYQSLHKNIQVHNTKHPNNINIVSFSVYLLEEIK